MREKERDDDEKQAEKEQPVLGERLGEEALRPVHEPCAERGAGAVNGAKSFFTQAFPEYWLFALGLIFILVTLFMPRGIMGFFQRNPK